MILPNLYNFRDRLQLLGNFGTSGKYMNQNMCTFYLREVSVDNDKLIYILFHIIYINIQLNSMISSTSQDSYIFSRCDFLKCLFNLNNNAAYLWNIIQNFYMMRQYLIKIRAMCPSCKIVLSCTRILYVPGSPWF